MALAKGRSCARPVGSYHPSMIPSQITESVLALPENDRLELARRIVESVASDRRVGELVAEGVRRIEDVVTGKTRGLSEDDFRRAIG